MIPTVPAAERIARHFDSPFLRNYTRSKLRTDPLYAAVAERLRGHELPLLDVGCGAGLMSFYLREYGFTPPITGLDHDRRKINAAAAIAPRYRELTFVVGDARAPFQHRGSVLLLDLLHYFDEVAQKQILANAAAVVPAGGVVIIRNALADGSWRHRATWVAEMVARGSRWLKAERLNFPARELILAAFGGFDAELVPLWGRTPFNNYLFVFRRSVDGTTNE